MKINKTDNPGVVLPPPLIYVVLFASSILLHRISPFRWNFLTDTICRWGGPVFIICSLLLLFASLWRFFESGNTLITFRPSRSLQKTGIYAYTRNPMYLGLLLLYSGIAFLKGNPWTFILIPFLILIVEVFVIRKEELYLEREYGEDFLTYKANVRRWFFRRNR